MLALYLNRSSFHSGGFSTRRTYVPELCLHGLLFERLLARAEEEEIYIPLLSLNNYILQVKRVLYPEELLPVIHPVAKWGVLEATTSDTTIMLITQKVDDFF